MKNENLLINSVPCTTWNWLKMNKDVITLDTDFEAYTAKITSIPQNVSVASETYNIDATIPKIFSGLCNEPNPKAYDNRRTDGSYIDSVTSESENKSNTNGENHALQKLINEIVPVPQFITIKDKQEKPIVINCNFSKSSVAAQLIYAAENSESTVIFLIEGDSPYNILQTKIYAAPNAKIHIAKVQLMGKNSLLLDDTGITCDENAKASFTQIELGGLHNNSGLNVTLNGYQSKFISNVAYLCTENQFLDMNHIVNHYGKKTECNMKVNGTLKDSATKTYRGTIDFKNGCCGSKGNEMEETLVLNPKAINKSLPNILCDEEDVEGEHGATIGRLSSDILFYMQSRGISEAEAEKLMSRAKIQAVADLIPDENIKNVISDFLDK